MTYDYDLPENRIAQYPVRERDNSKLLLFTDRISLQDIFRNIDRYLPPESFLFSIIPVLSEPVFFSERDRGNY